MASDSIGLVNSLGKRAASLMVFAVIATAFMNPIQADDPFAQYDLMMMSRPELPEGKFAEAMPDGLLPLWQKALARPDASLRRMTIDTLANTYKRGLSDAVQTKTTLLEFLNDPKQDLDVVASSARTLIAFDARETAAAMAGVARKRGDTISKIVEPALAAWQSPLFKDDWLKRLEHGEAGETMMLFAINGVQSLGVKEADAALYQFAIDPNASAKVRLQSAKAIGSLGSPAAITRAKSLAAPPAEHSASVLQPMLAIAMLGSDDSQDCIKILTQLAAHPTSAIQAASLERLRDIDPAEVDALADDLISSRDVNVRRQCIRAMMHRPSKKRIASIAPLLDDINPKLRREVAAGLLDWSKQPALREEVIAQTMLVLRNDSWQGCEQAILVLTKLNHKDAGARFVDLLGHPRGEVKVASAWGLTKLADKRYLSAMLEHAESVQQGFASGTLNDFMPGASLQVAHLFNAFGDQMYAPAENVLRAYLPKNIEWGTESRAAACWAIGLLLADEAPQDLVDQLTERYRDVNGMIPEQDLFRSMCAITFGRMKLKSRLPELRKVETGSPRFGQACYWAIEQMTGEKPQPIPLRTIYHDGWFISPIRDK